MGSIPRKGTTVEVDLEKLMGREICRREEG